MGLVGPEGPEALVGPEGPEALVGPEGPEGPVGLRGFRIGQRDQSGVLLVVICSAGNVQCRRRHTPRDTHLFPTCFPRDLIFTFLCCGTQDIGKTPPSSGRAQTPPSGSTGPHTPGAHPSYPGTGS